MPERPAAPAVPEDRHEVLEGEVASVVYQDEGSGFAVVGLETARGRQTAAGDLAPASPGERLRLHGRWATHPRFGRQFKVAWSERLTPTTLDGLERYLGSGAFPGIGPEMARRLVRHFGDGTIAALEAGEWRLREVPGIGRKRAATLAAAFRESRDRHRVLAELRGMGLTAAQSRKLYEHWQAGAVERVRRDPYGLIGELAGVGLETAERMARSLGIPPDSPARARGIALHALREAAKEGHACLPLDAVREELSAREVSAQTADEALAALAGEGRIRLEDGLASGPDGGLQRWACLASLEEAESEVARHVRRLLDGPRGPLATQEQVLRALSRVPVRPDESQRAALEMALREPFAVLTGGPGTGKTTTLRLLMEILQAARLAPILLASPTGRAAKRLQEATGCDASTIHRMLGYDPRQDLFRHDADHPIPARYLVVDEVSMLDLPLAHALLRAVPDGCRVLFVGDADQLPSVGPGTVLRDLVAAPEVPTTRLRRVYRQGEDSGIVEAAHAVLAGLVPEGGGAEADFFVVRQPDPQKAASVVEQLVCERIPRRYGMDPRRDVLVLSPMYRGALGVTELNARLGRRLNPDGAAADWCAPFRAGDRVMVVRNDYEREVFNGDTGEIREILDGELLVEIGGRSLSYRRDELEDLVQAWCVTVHRAQGCEARAAVVVLDRSHYVLLRRSLLYTAITRGRELVVVVADPGALRRAVQTAAEARRFGRLRERLAAGT